MFPIAMFFTVYKFTNAKFSNLEIRNFKIMNILKLVNFFSPTNSFVAKEGMLTAPSLSFPNNLPIEGEI